MPGLQTKLVHGDDSVSRVSDVVAPINVTTTFKYSDDPSKYITADEITAEQAFLPDYYVYSRVSHPNSIRIEELFESILGRPAVVYNGGVPAFNALLYHIHPKRIFFDQCYHGCRGAADLLTRFGALEQHGISEEDLENLQAGDLIHIESPVNPEGTSFDLAYYAKRAHDKGAFLSVDSTFAPFPLQDPFEFGADIVMHSATKYFAGHSDLLAGILVVKDQKQKLQLLTDRIYLGTNIGNLEAYLLIRSLRTYELRIRQQSANAEKLVKFLSDNLSRFDTLESVSHSSLQTEPFVKRQLPNGYNPTFSIKLTSADAAKALPSKLKYFHHATSLGGVESLIEWRALSDSKAPKNLLRISTGVETVEDLIADFEQALSNQ